MDLNRLVQDGTFSKMIGQIEDMVAKAGGKKAVLVTLSTGGLIMHYILSKLVNSTWKERNVERWISLATPFGGSNVNIRCTLSPSASDTYYLSYLHTLTVKEMKEVEDTWPSWWFQRPTFMADTEVLVSAKERIYTQNDVQALLIDSNLPDAAQAYTVAGNVYTFAELSEPEVTVDCFYSAGTDTMKAIHFDHVFNHRATRYDFETGDGVALERSLSLCWLWQSDKTKFQIHKFNKVYHTNIVHSPEAAGHFQSIIRDLYETSPSTSLFVV